MKDKIYYPLNDKYGSVQLIDYMGSDQAIAEAAWVSTTGLKHSSSVPQLLDYLMRHGHMSPFEMCELKFKLTVPLAVMAQLGTHRTASRNQISARYVELPQDNYIPAAWRAGGTGHNKQQSSEHSINNNQEATQLYEALARHAHTVQQELLQRGVAPELARLTHLQSQYTSLIWKIDLRNLMNFLTQRTNSHAQAEIRAYAIVMQQIAEALFPHAMQAWKIHQQRSVTFSAEELPLLAQLLSADASAALASSGLRASKQAEFISKLHTIQEASHE